MFQKRLDSKLDKFQLDRLQAYIGSASSDMTLVSQYQNAIDIIIADVVGQDYTVDMVSHPLLYLMRHSIELALKENIKYLNQYSKLGINIKTHSIDELFNDFQIHYEKVAIKLNFKTELNIEYEKYTDILKELVNSLGNDWSSFRYIFSNKGTKIFNPTKTINVFELYEKYNSSLKFLFFNADVISPYTDYYDYIQFDCTIEKDSLGFVLQCFSDYEKSWLIKKLDEKYIVINKNEIWYDEIERYYLQIKTINKKCYIIPFR